MWSIVWLSGLQSTRLRRISISYQYNYSLQTVKVYLTHTLLFFGCSACSSDLLIADRKKTLKFIFNINNETNNSSYLNGSFIRYIFLWLLVGWVWGCLWIPRSAPRRMGRTQSAL